MRFPDTKRISQVFQRRGIRRTRQREAIYAALVSCASHPTAEELHRMVQQQHTGISLATIYNTLDIFTDKGMCQRLNVAPGAGGACRFDADMSEHVHLVMPDGRVVDVPDELGRELLDRMPPELIEQVEGSLNVRIGRINLQFHAMDPDEEV